MDKWLSVSAGHIFSSGILTNKQWLQTFLQKSVNKSKRKILVFYIYPLKILIQFLLATELIRWLFMIDAEYQ